MKKSYIWIVFVSLLALGQSAHASVFGGGSSIQGGGQNKKNAKVSFLAHTERVVKGKDFYAAIVLDIQPHWHTYWKNPGSAGKGLEAVWDLPAGVKDLGLVYTLPTILRQKIEGETPGKPELLESYVYIKQAVYLAKFRVTDAFKGKSLAISGKVKFGICAEQCVLQREILTLNVPIGPAPGSENAFVSGALKQVPPTFSKSKTPFEVIFKPVTLQAGKKTAIKIEFQVKSPDTGLFSPSDLEETQYGFFPDANDNLFPTVPKYVLSKNQKDGTEKAVVLFTLESLEETPPGDYLLHPIFAGSKSGKPLAYELDLPVTITPGDHPMGANPTPTPTGGTIAGLPPAPGTAPAPTAGDSFASMSLFLKLGVAFLAGLVLNFMPCVLPVLSVKLLGFVQDAQQGGRVPIHGALAYTAGILTSFLGLAALLVGFAKAGTNLGWGFQFANPYFVLLMSVILLVFALNLFGVFEITFQGGAKANQLASGHGLGGAFMSGVLATTLATPCTAPFLSPVIGFALNAPGLHTFFLLGAMGLGMASLYVVLTGFPGLRRLVPKPGPWMNRFRQIMGLLLVATLAWMIFYMADQWPGEGLLLLLGVLFLTAVATWAWRMAQMPDTRNPLVWKLATLALMVGATGWAASDKPNPRASSPVAQLVAEGGWRPFNEKAISDLQSQGKTVFVDFTATWCLTCKFNRLRLFDREAFKDLVKQNNVTLMVADYTEQPESMTKFMARYGRSAVPLYLVFPGETSKAAMVLSESPSFDEVQEAFKKSRSQTASVGI